MIYKASIIRFLAVPMALIAFTALANQEDKVTLNFRDTDIRVVIETVGSYTGRSFVLDPRVKGRVTIISSHPVSRGAIYDVLLSTLRLYGYSAVDSGGVTKIIPMAQARRNRGAVIDNRVKVAGDRVVTQVYPLQFESAEKLAPVLKPLVSANNTIFAHAGSNTLIITDYADNIKRLDRIIESIDQPRRGEVVVLKLKHMPVMDFVDMFEKLYLGKSVGAPASSRERGGRLDAGVGRRFVMVPDLNSNSLFLRSENRIIVEQIRGLVEKLDTPQEESENVHIVRLEYAEPGKVAEILRQLIPGGGKNAVSPSLTKGSLNVGIHTDDATRSLIIIAPENVYKDLRAVIGKLDVRRPQIYLEALIAEISSDKVAEFGIQWQSLRGLDTSKATGVTGVGGINLGGTGATIGEVSGALGGGVTFGKGLNVGIVSGVITLANGTKIPNLLALARAMETTADANILSTPTLLAMDNEEAKIIVGQNVPLLTGSYAPNTGGASGAINPFQTIERRDIGLTLKIKPRISANGSVQLTIYSEVSSLAPFTMKTGTVDVVTNKRSLESTVMVRDGQTIALGGLIKDQIATSVDKTPILGDIPFLGALFRFENRRHVKTNLMVFLRPHIFRIGGDADAVSTGAYEYIIDRQGEVRPAKRLMLPDMPSPRLPPMGHGAAKVSSANKPATAGSKTTGKEKKPGATNRFVYPVGDEEEN